MMWWTSIPLHALTTQEFATAACGDNVDSTAHTYRNTTDKRGRSDRLLHEPGRCISCLKQVKAALVLVLVAPLGQSDSPLGACSCRLRHRCAAATLPLQARARTRDPPAPCDGRPAPHAWPSTHQPRHQHCMVSHQELLDRETPPQVSQEHCMVWVHACGGVGRLRRRTPHPLHRACASACCTTPTRKSSGGRTLACSSSTMRLAPHCSRTQPCMLAHGAFSSALCGTSAWLAAGHAVPSVASGS